MRDHWTTQKELQARLDYDEMTGLFFWKDIRDNRYRNKLAGSSDRRGYVSISWNNRHLQAHQLAWCYVHGAYAPAWVDHKDGNPSNNAIHNLRPATPSENNRNRRTPSNNKSGFKGVYLHVASGTWHASIKVGDKQEIIGRYQTPQEAHAAYVAVAKERFGEFARAA